MTKELEFQLFAGLDPTLSTGEKLDALYAKDEAEQAERKKIGRRKISGRPNSNGPVNTMKLTFSGHSSNGAAIQQLEGRDVNFGCEPLAGESSAAPDAAPTVCSVPEFLGEQPPCRKGKNDAMPATCMSGSGGRLGLSSCRRGLRCAILPIVATAMRV
ncbi:hypothetical protein MSAN_00419300 [Mycena sanguinolenta]|uniref:Uncharacterized protein n=1 Tax=Mycena sanguinolenta TaxID=230812 RepID=A0A8H7DH85_9AGAR|nr:hypothetical protein MSAN_00419300 [Mycena sanguinolenta]